MEHVRSAVCSISCFTHAPICASNDRDYMRDAGAVARFRCAPYGALYDNGKSRRSPRARTTREDVNSVVVGRKRNHVDVFSIMAPRYYIVFDNALDAFHHNFRTIRMH